MQLGFCFSIEMKNTNQRNDQFFWSHFIYMFVTDSYSIHTIIAIMNCLLTKLCWMRNNKIKTIFIRKKYNIYMEIKRFGRISKKKCINARQRKIKTEKNHSRHSYTERRGGGERKSPFWYRANQRDAKI